MKKFKVHPSRGVIDSIGINNKESWSEISLLDQMDRVIAYKRISGQVHCVLNFEQMLRAFRGNLDEEVLIMSNDDIIAVISSHRLVLRITIIAEIGDIICYEYDINSRIRHARMSPPPASDLLVATDSERCINIMEIIYHASGRDAD